MKWMRSLKYHRSAVSIIMPAGAGYLGLLRAVKDLPVSERFRTAVYSKLFGKKILHQVKRQFPAKRRLWLCHEKRLLKLVRMGLRPLIVIAYEADGGIDSISRARDLRRQLRAVTVSDHIGAPAFRQPERQLLIAGFPRQCKTSLCLLHDKSSPSKLSSVQYSLPAMVHFIDVFLNYIKTAALIPVRVRQKLCIFNHLRI